MEELKSSNASKQPHVWCDGETIVIGTWPHATAKFDFAQERLQLVQTEKPLQKKFISLRHLALRDTGSRFEIETQETIYEFASAVQTLLSGLEVIESLVPGTLDKMCEQKGRSKRPVGHSREALYDLPSQRKYAEKIKTGHFVATNNKTMEALGVLRIAARLANLTEDQFVVRRR